MNECATRWTGFGLSTYLRFPRLRSIRGIGRRDSNPGCRPARSWLLSVAVTAFSCRGYCRSSSSASPAQGPINPCRRWKSRHLRVSRMFRTLVLAILEAPLQLGLFVIAFKITSCHFSIGSTSRAGIARLGVSTSPGFSSRPGPDN